jgi:hypothetical protein
MGVATLKPFPDVDPGEIKKAAGEVATATAALHDAAAGVGGLEDSTSWKSPSARPSWDDQLRQRAADLGGARQVLDHFHDILTTAATQTASYKEDYDAAVQQLQWFGPQPPNDPSVPSLLPGPDGTPWAPPTPEQKEQYAADLSAYNAAIRHINDLADNAELCLAVCAAEMTHLTQGVSFADPPPAMGTDIVSELIAGATSPILGPDGQILTVYAAFPAFGAPQGAIYVNGVPVPAQFLKGKAFERSVLRSLGISNEAKTLFRPGGNGAWTLPRIKNGQFKGTFPDSLRLGVLEIKSGTTEISMSSPQIRVQLWVARTLSRPFNLIVSRETPVDPALIAEAKQTGGSVYTRVSENVYYDRDAKEYVRLRGGGDGSRTPLTEDEVSSIPQKVREAIEKIRNGGPPPGGGSGGGTPADDYVTTGEYTDAWADTDEDGYQHMVVPDGGGENGVPALPGGPIVPVVPLPGPLPVPVPGPVPVFPGGGLIPVLP